MESGAITSYIDVAQIVLYAFWIFFFGLIFYLRREDKREGYPLESSRNRRIRIEGFPGVPAPKSFRLPHGGVTYAPHPETEPPLNAAPSAPWPGAPLEPTGDPLGDGVGPAAYALRADTPDLTIDGHPRIVPLRTAQEFHADPRDPELRGMPVYAADGQSAGTVTDVWIDLAEPQIRYVEIAVPAGAAPTDAGPNPAAGATERAVLAPIHSIRIDAERRRVRVEALLAAQLTAAPAPASPNRVTLREEDRISAYFAGGYLYAEPSRLEPLI